jgi:thioredoxin reductase
VLDVLIVGAGPAGLSAALVLGRSRRQVVVCDHGRPRNAASRALHGYLTRDGIPPRELLKIGREQLRTYETVEIRNVQVTGARNVAGGFEATLADGERLVARKLLLATGLVDEVPRIEGIEAFYGRSVHHCPYCDGWEWRDRPLAAYGRERKGIKMALRLTAWSRDLVLCTDGPAELAADERACLERLGIPVRSERIVRLEGVDGRLERLVFDEGSTLARSALFFNTGCPQQSGLARSLGCDLGTEGSPKAGDHGKTNVPGLYVAGDASRDVQLAIIAAAEGAAAAVHIHSTLTREHLTRSGCAGVLDD